ncbi:MAG TPA: hypothetical protein VFJ95_04895 [Gammaproteobacteria bacterium]|nr:hypothetical protein [Gammaproteobacteria bacterium]
MTRAAWSNAAIRHSNGVGPVVASISSLMDNALDEIDIEEE